MKRMIISSDYSVDRADSVLSDIDGMVEEVWDNYQDDGLSAKEACDIVIDHLTAEDLYGYKLGKDFTRKDVMRYIRNYWPGRGIKSSMTPQEVNDAIEQNKPFNIRDYTEYFDPPHDSEALLPSEMEIGREYINTEDASEFNMGTQFKVLDIVPESERDDWEMQFDYVFKVQTADGNVFNIHYDSEDYVGVLVE